MATFKTNYLFDTTETDRIIVTHNPESDNFHASVRLVGGGAGYSTYATGNTPEIAIARALENVSVPERWRVLRY